MISDLEVRVLERLRRRGAQLGVVSKYVCMHVCSFDCLYDVKTIGVVLEQIRHELDGFGAGILHNLG
jgi:hypothetical protein